MSKVTKKAVTKKAVTKKAVTKKAVTKKAVTKKAGTWYVIGKMYFIQTVTLYYTGRLIGINEQELIMEDAAWIADTGRFADALKSLSFNEVEPFPDGPIIIGRGALICGCEISSVPRIQK